MATIRLNKLCREFNIGLGTLVEFLKNLSCFVQANPNAKIDESYYPRIKEAFAKDAKMKELSDKMPVTFSEVMTSDVVMHIGPAKRSKKAKARKKQDAIIKKKAKATQAKKKNVSDIKPSNSTAPIPSTAIFKGLDWDIFSDQ